MTGFTETIITSSIFTNNGMFSMCQVLYASSCLIFTNLIKVNLLINPILLFKKNRDLEKLNCAPQVYADGKTDLEFTQILSDFSTNMSVTLLVLLLQWW